MCACMGNVRGEREDGVCVCEKRRGEWEACEGKEREGSACKGRKGKRRRQKNYKLHDKINSHICGHRLQQNV